MVAKLDEILKTFELALKARQVNAGIQASMAKELMSACEAEQSTLGEMARELCRLRKILSERN